MEPKTERRSGGFATRAVHAALDVEAPTERAVAPAIWPAATWAVDRSEHLGELLTDSREGYVYGRYDNPTNTALHAVVAALHDTEAAWSFASGTAAIHAVVEVLRHRDGVPGRLLATPRLYGGTWTLFERMRRDAGWLVDHVDLGDLDVVADALTAEHTVVYAETIANPSTQVVDLVGLAELCEGAGVALVVDNTFASPYLCRPVELGATAAVESATKFLGGHGDVVAGVVAAGRDTVARAREVAIELGASLGPFEAWLVARGIQTLPLRIRQIGRNATAVAEVLAASDVVDAVAYPGLAAHPQHQLASRLFDGAGFGGVLSVELGTRERAVAFADASQLLTRAVSLGSTQSLVLHPASTSHRQLDEQSLTAAGLTPGTVRVSLGIEDTEDLVADVTQALAAAAGGS